MALLDNLNPAQITQALEVGRKDPFSRPLPGASLLGDGGMLALGNQFQMPSNNFASGAPQMPGMQQFSTDFADTQPGLPNLPDNFQGFGYGQFAPKEHQGDIRQQLIQQLMQSLSQGGNFSFSGMGGL